MSREILENLTAYVPAILIGTERELSERRRTLFDAVHDLLQNIQPSSDFVEAILNVPTTSSILRK